jgi:hypothetical protein
MFNRGEDIESRRRPVREHGFHHGLRGKLLVDGDRFNMIQTNYWPYLLLVYCIILYGLLIGLNGELDAKRSICMARFGRPKQLIASHNF